MVKLALQGGPQISQFCPKLLFIKFSVCGCDFAIIVKAYFKQKLLFPIFETHEPYGKFQAHIFFNLALKYHWSAHGPKIFLKILGLALNTTVITQIYCLKNRIGSPKMPPLSVHQYGSSGTKFVRFCNSSWNTVCLLYLLLISLKVFKKL